MRLNRANGRALRGVALTVFELFLMTLSSTAQSQNPEPANQVWGALNVSFELSERSRVTAFIEKHDGEEDALFKERKFGVLFGYRVRRLGKHLSSDNDKENEYNLVLAAGYEYIVTDQDKASSIHEHRLVLQATPKYAFGLGILAQDRNRLEFRWQDDGYDFRYRNRLTVERPFRIGKLRLSPYAAGELFWARNHHAWNENQYAFGVQWPVKTIFKLNTYYLRQNCTTCGTDPLNVLGLTANFYFDWPRRR